MRTKQMLLALLTLLVCPSLMFAGTVSGKVTYTGTPANKNPSICPKNRAAPSSMPHP